jgi:hypothetical protein
MKRQRLLGEHPSQFAKDNVTAMISEALYKMPGHIWSF